MSFPRTFASLGAAAVLIAAFAPAADARHHGHHRGIHAVKARPLPAHQRPDYVGLAGAPVPGLIDVGYGPVFPFEGWPK